MTWTLSFLSAKDTVKRMQRQVIDWDNTPANHVSDKQLIKIYKDLSKSKIKKKKTQHILMSIRFKQTFHQRR